MQQLGRQTPDLHIPHYLLPQLVVVAILAVELVCDRPLRGRTARTFREARAVTQDDA